MERTESRSKSSTIAIILIIIAAGMMISCTQSLFMVKGSRNQVEQKNESNADVSADSTNVKLDIK